MSHFSYKKEQGRPAHRTTLWEDGLFRLTLTTTSTHHTENERTLLPFTHAMSSLATLLPDIVKKRTTLLLSYTHLKKNTATNPHRVIAVSFLGSASLVSTPEYFPTVLGEGTGSSDPFMWSYTSTYAQHQQECRVNRKKLQKNCASMAYSHPLNECAMFSRERAEAPPRDLLGSCSEHGCW